MTPRPLFRIAIAAGLFLSASALAADIVIAPPASGGVTITNAAGNTPRLRVADDGTVTLPGLTALPVAGTGLCIDIATGRIGTCPASGGSGGTVTGIIAGTGLSGGTITTTGTIGIADGGVGTAQLANGAVTAAKMAANGCTTGQVLQFNGSAWACASVASAGTVTSIATGTGLTGGPITASGTIGLAATQLLPTAACSANQVPKWNGSAWTCAADATGTVNGLVQGGNAFGATATLGTTDNQAVILIANNESALRIVPNAFSPNLIGGKADNSVAAGVSAATIAGGGAAGTTDPVFGLDCGGFCANQVNEYGGTVGGGLANQAGAAGAYLATVAGGFDNRATGNWSAIGGGANNRAGSLGAIGGGRGNSASGSLSAVAGGFGGSASGANAFVGGGEVDSASGQYGTVGGGQGNAANGVASTIPGGRNNTASGFLSFAAGRLANAMHDGAFVWAADLFSRSFSSIHEHEFAVKAIGGVRFVTEVDNLGVPANTFTIADSRLFLPEGGAVFRGSRSFIHATSARNAFLGVDAGNAVSIGFENAALGYEALLGNTIGAGNTAVGYRAMASMTESFNSTAVGAQALANATSAGNIALGSFAGFNITTGANNIAIGNTGVAGDADTLRLGGAQSRAFIAGVRGITTGSNNAIPVLIDGSGQLGTASSSRRFKDDIETMGEASEGLMHLRPVTFHYKGDDDPSGKRLQYGLIAEEVAAVYPGLVARSPDGQIETVMYQFLPPMLLNEVQKQRRTIETQAAEIASLKAQAGRLAAVEQELAAIRQALGIR